MMYLFNFQFCDKIKSLRFSKMTIHSVTGTQTVEKISTKNSNMDSSFNESLSDLSDWSSNGTFFFEDLPKEECFWFMELSEKSSLNDSSEGKLSTKISTMDNNSLDNSSLEWNSSMEGLSDFDCNGEFLDNSSMKGSSEGKLSTKNSTLDNNSLENSYVDNSSLKGSYLEQLFIERDELYSRKQKHFNTMNILSNRMDILSNKMDKLPTRNSPLTTNSPQHSSLDTLSVKGSSVEKFSTQNSTLDAQERLMKGLSGKKMSTKNSTLDSDNPKQSSLDNSSKKDSSLDKLSTKKSTLRYNKFQRGLSVEKMAAINAMLDNDKPKQSRVDILSTKTSILDNNSPKHSSLGKPSKKKVTFEDQLSTQNSNLDNNSQERLMKGLRVNKISTVIHNYPQLSDSSSTKYKGVAQHSGTSRQKKSKSKPLAPPEFGGSERRNGSTQGNSSKDLKFCYVLKILNYCTKQLNNELIPKLFKCLLCQSD